MHWRPSKLQTMFTRRSPTFKRQDQVVFFQELGELLQSGYSIAQSLDILAAAHERWVTWLTRVKHGLNQGIPLNIILDHEVSRPILLQIKLADQHGNLSQTLVEIGQNLAQIQQQQQKIKQVLQYPLVLICLLFVMLVGMKCFLYPILQQWQGASTNTTSQTSQTFYLIIGILVGLLGLGILRWRQMLAQRRLVILAHLWWIGPIVKAIVTYQVAQQLATLLANGLTVPEIIEEMCDVRATKNKHLAVVLAEDARRWLKTGQTLSDYILKQPYYNRALAGYFSRGHEPQVLAGYLAYYAKNQLQQVMQRTNRLIGTLQPLFFGIIGLAIIAVYLSMLLPMYQTIGGLYQ